MRRRLSIFFESIVLNLPWLVSAQTSCSNYGIQNTSNSSECLCPPGFGDASCAQPSCGGTIFDGLDRSLTPSSSSGGGFPNLTAAGCSCESGWTGTGCNVCTSLASCQSGYSSVFGNSTSGLGDDTLNGTLVCNTNPLVYAAGEMSCQVNNPTLQTLYPLQSTLNILRTLNSTLSPLSSVNGTTLFPSSSSSSSSSLIAQLFYDGVEQFYCEANSCQQTSSSSSNTSTSSITWTCQNLACTCITNTSFCGGVTLTELTTTIDGLNGQLVVSCDSSNTCSFQQNVIDSVFGTTGLTLDDCVFGECVTQGVIDTFNSISTSTTSTGKELSGGVIAGLAVVGGLLLIGFLLLCWGWTEQRKARHLIVGDDTQRERWGKVGVQWRDVTYTVPSNPSAVWLSGGIFSCGRRSRKDDDGGREKTILDSVSGYMEPGQMLGILGPSGAGKTTLVEILAGKSKSGTTSGLVSLQTPAGWSRPPRIAFVPQQDILPPMLTVYEALMFAAELRLPESVTIEGKNNRVWNVMRKLGIAEIAHSRIGNGASKHGRGISGGEMRRVSIGLELVGRPDIIVLDEPTSGLDSVSAMKVGQVLYDVAHDPEIPTVVISSIHQPSSQLYGIFDSILLLSHGRTLYFGEGDFAPVNYFKGIRDNSVSGQSVQVQPYREGYNVADYLLEIASDVPVGLFSIHSSSRMGLRASPSGSRQEGLSAEKMPHTEDIAAEELGRVNRGRKSIWGVRGMSTGRYAATFLTQLEVLSGREWKILRRDKTLFFTHIAVAAILGVFCGGLYYQTGTTIAGFQSMIGCLFFLGALVAFSSLSALYNVVEIRPLFLRERSNAYYSPTAWLLSRFIFDVVPLRIIPTIIVSTITYWMAGLASGAAQYFKFLFILVLYTLAMTFFNFLLGTVLQNGGIAILLSALTALYQMTYAGFFVHITSIPPVLRWLQWLCPLKYTLEALSVNEVNSGLQIQDTLDGVPVDVSAVLIMQLLFGFGTSNYYRDVLVLFAFIAGFAVAVIGVVWLFVRERR